MSRRDVAIKIKAQGPNFENLREWAKAEQEVLLNDLDSADPANGALLAYIKGRISYCRKQQALEQTITQFANSPPSPAS